VREAGAPIVPGVKRAKFLTLLLASMLSTASAQQQLPFTVTIVDWQREALASQLMAHRSEEHGREVMFCVESWTTLPVNGGIERVLIERVRRERTGNRRRIHDVGGLCLSPSGRVLPMIHTHADGNCQFSPTDLLTVVARRAPFDGVQCGERHFVWVVAWQVLAIANHVEMQKFR
jgi:hypothetical protein